MAAAAVAVEAPAAPMETEVNGFGEVVVKKNESKGVVGLIYPPPEIRNIVDKTAAFVAKNGIEFAARIASERAGQARFRFLQPDNPYHVYFQHKINLISEGREDDPDAPQMPTSVSRSGPAAGAATIVSDLEKVSLSDPPEKAEFLADPPSIMAQDLDILKLTAQFVAKNGRSFLTNLMKREAGNYQFDFLRPQHSLFHYFTNMVDQYTKILTPAKELTDRIEKEASDRFAVLHTIQYGAEWQKRSQDEQKEKEEEAEKERVAYQSIDWHDFLIVETVEFGPDDTALPPPIQMSDLGARIIEMENLERARKEKARSAPTGETVTEAMEMDMEESSDEDEAAPAAAPAVAPTTAPPVEKPEEIKIRAYDPKAKVATAPKGDQYLISPLTGERILASKMTEHMRIGLLDPKWKEQKDRMAEEVRKNKEAWALGQAGSVDVLKGIASRRTDIFGRDDFKESEDTSASGRVKMTWDGVTQDAAREQQQTAEAARDEARQVKAKEDAVRREREREDEVLKRKRDAVNIGPAAPTSSAPGAFPPSTFGAPPPPGMAPPPPPGAMPPGMTAPDVAAPVGLLSVPGMPTIMPPAAPAVPTAPAASNTASETAAVQPPPVATAASTAAPASTTSDERPAKRLRTDGLEDEQSWIESHPMEFTIEIECPTITGKYNDQLTGQVLSLEVLLTDKVSTLKAKIQAACSIPPGKQTLKIGSSTLNNVNSLAFYNAEASKRVLMSEKTRGGKRK